MTFPNKVFETLSEHEILIYVRTFLFPTPPLPTHTHPQHHHHEAADEGGACPRENPRANPKRKSEAAAAEGTPTVTRLRSFVSLNALANIVHHFRRQSLHVPVEPVKRPGQRVFKTFWDWQVFRGISRTTL